MTTAVSGLPETALNIAFTSSTVRRVIARSAPGIGGFTGVAPGERINLS